MTGEGHSTWKCPSPVSANQLLARYSSIAEFSVVIGVLPVASGPNEAG